MNNNFKPSKTKSFNFPDLIVNKNAFLPINISESESESESEFDSDIDLLLKLNQQTIDSNIDYLSFGKKLMFKIFKQFNLSQSVNNDSLYFPKILVNFIKDENELLLDVIPQFFGKKFLILKNYNKNSIQIYVDYLYHKMTVSEFSEWMINLLYFALTNLSKTIMFNIISSVIENNIDKKLQTNLLLNGWYDNDPKICDLFKNKITGKNEFSKLRDFIFAGRFVYPHDLKNIIINFIDYYCFKNDKVQFDPFNEIVKFAGFKNNCFEIQINNQSFIILG